MIGKPLLFAKRAILGQLCLKNSRNEEYWNKNNRRNSGGSSVGSIYASNYLNSFNITVPVEKPVVIPEEILCGEDPLDEAEVGKAPANKEEGPGAEDAEAEENKEQDFSDRIKFLLTPRQKVLKLSDASFTQLPIMASVRSESLPKKIQSRAPVDLLCVIDKSGSMSGDKIKLVQASLKYLLSILGENDRISLIEFQTSSTILTPLLRCGEKNKEVVESKIEGLMAGGGTNITSGMNNALQMIAKRKFKNPITCIFLLSDGADDAKGAEVRIRNLIQQYQISDNFTIHTFGYGSDHDPMVMRQIAQEKDGNFYYIENVSKVDEYFVLSLSGLLSIIAEKVEIRLSLIAEQEAQFGSKYPLVVSKLYGGDMIWSFDQETKEHVVRMNHLLGGVSKDFLLEIQFPALRRELTDLAKSVTVMKGRITASFVNSGSKLSKSNELTIQLLNPKEKIKDFEENEDVEINYFRVRSAEVIGEAAKLAEQGTYEEGKGKLQALIQDLEKSKYKDDKVLSVIISDCHKALKLCEPKVFENEGKAFMFKKERGHMRRMSSCENILYANSFQEDMMDDLKKKKN